MSNPFSLISHLISDGLEALQWIKCQRLMPGPLFPILLNWTNYQGDKNLLSWIYIVAGAALGAAWAIWIRHRGSPIVVQIILACFPPLIYYSFLVSTDLLYSVIIWGWFLTACAFQERKKAAYWYLCSGFAILALLARPNALVLTPLMVIMAWRANSSIARVRRIISWILVGFYGFLYYVPYYLVHDANASVTHYWGVYPSEYYSGTWLDWPSWFGRPISWVVFMGSKLLYAVGLRPSYSHVSIWLVAIRALPGVLFIPGLVYGCIKGRLFDRVFVLISLVPVFIGAAQERYLLAIIPVLLLWGVQAAQCAWGYEFRSNKRAL